MSRSISISFVAPPLALCFGALSACSEPPATQDSSPAPTATTTQTVVVVPQPEVMPVESAGTPSVEPTEVLVMDLTPEETAAENPEEADAAVPEETVSTMVTEECAATEVMAVDKTAVQPADIIVAIDTSSSMGEEAVFLEDYMNAFSEQIIASGIDAHVVLIAGQAPAGGGGGGGGRMTYDVCIDAPLGSGTCPDDENLPIYAHIDSHVGSRDVLNVVIDTFPEWQQHLRPEASKSFVIISDDNPTDPPNSTAEAFSTSLEALAPDLFATWTFNGIFAIESCDLASAAGDILSELVTATGGVAGELCDQDFQPVFDRLAEQIITEAGSEIACEWELPPAPVEQTFSVDLVKVSRTTEASGTVPFMRAPSVADCALNSWYFDDELNPSKVLACPETCAAMQEEVGGQIEVSFGCELIEGCAASSSEQLGSTGGDGGSPGASCAFPLPPPPEGVVLDVSTINVRYTTPMGFGVVLGTVPSEADCADFGDGWFYDDPEAPTSYVLCPDTCARYQEGSARDVQALFGCASKPAKPPAILK